MHLTVQDDFECWAVYESVPADPHNGTPRFRAAIWTHNLTDGEVSRSLTVDGTQDDLTHRELCGMTLGETIVLGLVARHMLELVRLWRLEVQQ